jgi:hypothetical protein
MGVALQTSKYVLSGAHGYQAAILDLLLKPNERQTSL